MMGMKFKSTGSKSSTLARVKKMKVKRTLVPVKPGKPTETCLSDWSKLAPPAQAARRGASF